MNFNTITRTYIWYTYNRNINNVNYFNIYFDSRKVDGMTDADMAYFLYELCNPFMETI